MRCATSGDVMNTNNGDAMNDPRLSALRREPSPEFAAGLRVRLRTDDAAPAPQRTPWPIARLAASIVIVAVTGALFTVPAVRASAQSLLARFRVVNFVAVEVGEERVAELRSKELDLPDMVGRSVQILQEPTPPAPAASPAQAGTMAGIDVRMPTWLPPDVDLKTIDVTGPGLVRARIDTTRLTQLMDLLGIDDLEAPAALDGKTVDVHIPSVVRVRYEVRCDDCAVAEYIQAKAPEITLPDGTDLPALAEIGLRILGLSAAEARQFAGSIDWRSTMLLPVPWGATSFKHVDVNGHQGIAIEREIKVESPGDKPGAGAILMGRSGKVGAVSYQRILVWSDGGQVYGFQGNFRMESLLRMAYSIP
jgi:hypothetical protein